jgi:hypothetical protein
MSRALLLIALLAGCDYVNPTVGEWRCYRTKPHHRVLVVHQEDGGYHRGKYVVVSEYTSTASGLYVWPAELERCKESP